MKPVDRLGRNGNGRVIAERHIRCVKVIIDGFRDADKVQAEVGEFIDNMHGPIPADGDEGIQFPILVVPDSVVRIVEDINPMRCFHREVEWVTLVGGPEDRPAEVDDAADIPRGKFSHPSFDQSLESIQDSDDGRTERCHCGLGNTSYHSV